MVVNKSNIARLYTVEDQEIYREAYTSIFSSDSSIHLLGISESSELGAIKDIVSLLSPDVLLVGVKKTDKNIIGELAQIRADFPRLGLFLLFVFYNTLDLQLLRSLATKAGAGMAVFLRQSLDRADQMRGIIRSVNEGQIILDPALISLLLPEKRTNPFLRELTAREWDILNLLAKGYSNSAMAEDLYIDITTVRHHINNMYSKLKAGTGFNGKHSRVVAARLYLETTGELLITGVPE
ncbi:LuxR C-terminal-related transcriptional regulator [Chloroflexota bacterium]